MTHRSNIDSETVVWLIITNLTADFNKQIHERYRIGRRLKEDLWHPNIPRSARMPMYGELQNTGHGSSSAFGARQPESLPLMKYAEGVLTSEQEGYFSKNHRIH